MPDRRRAPAEDADGVVRLASHRQRRLVHDLAAEVAWEAEDGFRRWLKRSLGLDRIRTRSDAQRAIRGLMGLKAHGHAKEETA